MAQLVATRRLPAVRRSGVYSFTTTMTAEMITQITMRICIAIQKRGSGCTPPMVAGRYSMMACRSAIATACVRVSAWSLPITRLVSDLTVSIDRPIRRPTSSV
jgi:hypothetical protein